MSSKNKDVAQLFEHIMSNDVSLFPILPFVEPDESFDLEQPEPIDELPLLPLRNVVLFPGQVIPVSVSSERSLRLVHWLEQSGGYFGAITQSVTESDRPIQQELYPIGVVAQIEGVSETFDGKLGITIRGLQRFRLRSITGYEPFMTAKIDLMPEQTLKLDPESRALMSTLKENFLETYRILARPLPENYISRLQSIEHLGFIINFVLAATSISIEQRQMLLGIDDLKARGIKVLAYQQAELQMLRLKVNLAEKAKSEIERHNKEFFLQQQIRTIQEELGTGDDELDELHKQAQSKGWSPDVRRIFDKELRKAERLPPHAPEYAIQVQYLRTILSLPWGEYTQDNFDLKRAERKLNADHYGLEKVKERILEHLAVLKLKKDHKAPIICLYGPPGVGKTSLGKSIAESLGRKYVRISLGGVHDESEIRGHRRTYIGAMCGRIIQGIQRAGSCNPVFVLDEIDKLNDSYKGDPAAALLEVLDPEQNTTFHDNYLDIDFDLSKVLFIATANNISALSQPLRDRMELIEVTGYTAEEKHQIAKNYLIPKAIEEHGMEQYKLKFTPAAIDKMVEEYTRESGVRMLAKRVAEIMRKQAWRIGLNEAFPKSITPKLVREYLGKPTFQRDRYQGNELPGVVVGLAWTSVGGDILYIESSLHKGTDGKLILTGSLGDVMKESAVLALSYIRTYAEELGLSEDALKDKAVHIHVPEGAVPKDGPSAGITITTSLVSAITQRRVRPGIAMTGEITLRGKVLPVGGIKEKILAAKRSGITDIILCKENLRDIQEIKAEYLAGLNFHYVETIREVLDIALMEGNNLAH